MRFVLVLVVVVGVGCGTSPVPWALPGSSTTSPTTSESPSDTPANALLFEDFEDDDGGFTSSVTSGVSTWQWGPPTSGPNAAVSGVNVWATNLSGEHQNDEDSCLQTPDIALPPSGDISARFQMAVGTYENFDLWYIRIDQGGLLDTLDSGSGGDATQYFQYGFDLTSYADSTVQLLFCLDSDGDGFQNVGLYIDDVVVSAD